MQTLKYMKNVSMMAQKSQLPHMSATQRRMRSRFMVADDLKSSSKDHKSKNNFKRSSKLSKWSHHEESKTTS